MTRRRRGKAAQPNTPSGEQKSQREELYEICKKMNRGRYTPVHFPDGSVRLAHVPSQAEQDKDQAYADFFGEGYDYSTKAHIRSMSSLVSEICERLDIKEASIAPELLAKAWAESMGSFFAQQAQLCSLCDGVALITTLHPSVRFELTRMRQRVIARLNEHLGPASVRQLKIVLQ